MSDEDIDELESENQPTEEVVNTEDVEETSAEEESKNVDLVALNRKLYERAKKAEMEAKALRAQQKSQESQETAKETPANPTEKQDGLTPKDTIALLNAQVTNPDDIDFVEEYARFKNISIAEAVKNSVVKTELAQRAEQRQTAEATSTGTVRRGAVKPSDQQILKDVSQGKLPEDPAVFAEAYWEAKKRK